MGKDRSPAWGFSAESGASFECRLARGSTVISGFSACSSPKSFDLGGQPDGTYALSVRAVDGAGNASAAATDEYSLDTAADAPRIESSPGAAGRSPAPAWTFSSEPGATFECRLARGSTVVSDFSPCTSPRTYDLAHQPDGAYAFTVRATDPAGNLSVVTSDEYVLDTAADAPRVTSSPGPVGRDSDPAWSF